MTGRSKRKRKPLPTEPIQAVVESLTHDARGVARVSGKVVGWERFLCPLSKCEMNE